MSNTLTTTDDLEYILNRLPTHLFEQFFLPILILMKTAIILNSYARIYSEII